MSVVKQLRTLIWREWRDARALIAASLLIVPIASWAVHHVFFTYTESTMIAEIIVPALLALFGATLASDLVAGDVAAGRMKTMALLPSRQGGGKSCDGDRTTAGESTAAWGVVHVRKRRRLYLGRAGP